MNKPDILKQFEGPFRTRMGAVFIGERAVFRGLDVHSTFTGGNWMELHIFGITGKRLPANHIRVLEGRWTCSNYPDGRLWNNRVAALEGTTRSSGSAAISAAVAVSDAGIIGGQVFYFAADFLSRAKKSTEAGKSLEDFISEERQHNRIIKGFGRTMFPEKGDERLPTTLGILKRENVEIGPHFSLAFEVEKVLSTILKRPLPMTYAAAFVAVALDLGLTPQECYLFGVGLFTAGMTPCYLEALEKPEAATFVLSCERIQYAGPARRKWSS